MTEQPIEEIRDYFGEQIALYFAFIQTYTRSLIWPTVIGVATMVGHVQNGVEGNQLTIIYSILVSFWSVYFLSAWKRRQVRKVCAKIHEFCLKNHEFCIKMRGGRGC